MAASRRRPLAEEPEEHVNHERWLVTYADMLTLLMVLFIIMFAMSQIDQSKYTALKTGLAAGFGADRAVIQGSDAALDQQPPNGSPELVADHALRTLSDKEQQMVAGAVDAEQRRRLQLRYAEARAEAQRLTQLQNRLVHALTRAGLARDVQTTIDERGLVVSLVSRHVVFRPDVAALSPRGQAVVDTLAPVLRDVPNTLRIDGHTNQEPVQPRLYPTDWELSAARAVTVLRRLNEVGRVPQDRLSLSAFGHGRPLVDPDRAGSQRVNKRVDIVLLPGTGEETSQLIDDVMAARPGQQGAQG